MSEFTPTERTKVRRKPDRGHYDRETIYRILDEAVICHVWCVAGGLPFLKARMVLAVPLVEASAKVRTGFAVDADEEYEGPAWTGVLPLKWAAQAPVDDPRSKRKIPVPANIANYKRPQQR